MKPAFWPLAAACLLLGGCVSDSDPHYSLSGGEQGIFRSANAGRPIPVSEIKGMDEAQLRARFGAPLLDRKDGTARVLRYQSDACSLFVYMAKDRVDYVDAYDPKLRPLMNVNECAGSVAAQRRTS
ncbi:hypothetical protein SAMN02745126_02982 [Enhydrobacter aerosaccus]|uniref:SmpA / OmlA family protein n=1 Tax=Enhydrobacter aerosaccus TaxID=225324 RepID=A0A1T4PTP2_9HYPH|nr:hypothetical protein [Enhydrobacter aerosaccus]SJZ94278.1 hypothetical protein SAMN02745126_02982 [Enhydrobacter aerosaccus]